MAIRSSRIPKATSIVAQSSRLEIAMAMSRKKFVEHLIKRRLMTDGEVRAFEMRLPPEKLRDDDAAPFMQELIDEQKISAGDAAATYYRREGGADRPTRQNSDCA